MYICTYMQFHTRMCTHTQHTLMHTLRIECVHVSYVYVPAMYIRTYVHEHTTHSSLNEFWFLSVTFLCCVPPNCSPCCCVPPLHAGHAQHEPKEAGETGRNDNPTNQQSFLYTSRIISNSLLVIICSYAVTIETVFCRLNTPMGTWLHGSRI